mgnify:CR=1 FL=1
MGFGKILKCKSCGSEYDMCLGESEEGETETVLFLFSTTPVNKGLSSINVAA